MNILKELEKIRTEIGITEEIDSTLEDKVVFLNGTIGELKKMLFRSQTDIIASKAMIERTDGKPELQAMNNKGRENLVQFTSDAKQIAATLKVFTELLDQLAGSEKK